MIRPTVEYVGFHSTSERREYRLRLHSGPEIREYTVGIALAAFTSGQARYQDGPEISFLKLHRELLLDGVAPAEADYTVSDAELTEYRDAHGAPRNRLDPAVRRPAPAARPRDGAPPA
jgi:hypothetical protein